jgi:hypothetical protein
MAEVLTKVIAYGFLGTLSVSDRSISGELEYCFDENSGTS